MRNVTCLIGGVGTLECLNGAFHMKRGLVWGDACEHSCQQPLVGSGLKKTDEVPRSHGGIGRPQVTAPHMRCQEASEFIEKRSRSGFKEDSADLVLVAFRHNKPPDPEGIGRGDLLEVGRSQSA